ncbi:MAG: DNA translocase FtsK [Bacteroidia bacterium]|nr:DNA translocase FtsK [Bacteroidia bacterium]
MSNEKEKRNKIREKKEPKSKNKTSSSRPKITAMFQQMNVHKLRLILAFTLAITAVVIFISIFSYLFTWQSDFDKVSGSWFSLLSNPDIIVDNWFGKLGAFLAHSMVRNTFGIAALILPFLILLVAARLGTGKWFLPPGRTFGISLFLLLFVSAALGYFFQSSIFFPGGSYGLVINKWLTSLFGNAGTPLVLLCTLTVFILLTFNIKFNLSKQETDPAFETLHDEIPSVNRLKNDAPHPEIVINNLEISDPEDLLSDQVENDADCQQEDDRIIEEEFLPLETIAESADPAESLSELEVHIPETPPTPELSIEEPKPELTNDDPELISEKLLKEFGEFDPKLELGSYQPPTLDLLENHANKNPLSREELMTELEANKNRIVETLGHYNIGIEKIKATVGPTVTLFEIVPKAGIRISKIKNLEDDIALSLAALGIRIIAPIPGKGTIGIEVPNQRRETVSMKSILASEKFQQTNFELPIALGKTISNDVFITDLAKMPHLLMAGATGQGKSVGLNAVLVSLLYKKHPAEVKFVLIDPKKVELTLFKTIERHFLAKLPGEEESIITDTRKVVNTLNSLCVEMDKRYDLLKDAQVRNIKEYNAKFVMRKLNPNNGHAYLPYIVLVIDEFADLIMTAGKEIETPIARIAQLARAVGIHLIIATQRPSVNIITGTIKANFPARMAFKVSSKIDSRTILDTGGADQLIGSGDMLLSLGSDLIRLQCAYVDTSEVDKITEFIGSQRGYSSAFLLPEYVGEGEEGGLNALDASERDPMFEDAARIIVQHQQGSASLLQRKLKLGYNRAGRIIDQLEVAGIIGPFEGSKAREVKIKDLMALEQQLNAMHQG